MCLLLPNSFTFCEQQKGLKYSWVTMHYIYSQIPLDPFGIIGISLSFNLQNMSYISFDSMYTLPIFKVLESI